MRKLILRIDEHEPVALELPDGARVRVGRGPSGGEAGVALQRGENGVFELRVPSAAVSTEHAEIHLGEEGATVCDLGSTNGTFLQLSPRQPRLCAERILLGPHVTVELRDASLAVPGEAEPASPEELRSRVAAVLGLSPTAVRLVRSLPPPTDAPRAVLPIVGGDTLLVEWPEATLDFTAFRWLRSVVSRFNLRKRDEHESWSFTALSSGRTAALRLAKRAAPFESPVLLLGATGSGKGVLARDIHDHSLRAQGPFVRVNCGAIPQELFESVLFGHVQGAFTSATRPSAGLVDQADGGTLFLDEVGELSLPGQAKLLQFLDSGEYYPVGSPRLRRADVRVITATNRDLSAMMPALFRADLFYRIAEVTISISDPGTEDLRASVPGLLAEVATRNRTVVKPEEVERLSDLACTRIYGGHFRELRAALVRYLLLREPQRSVEETWRAAVDGKEGLNEALLRVDSPPPQELTAFVRGLEGLLRLQLARESSTVVELANRLGRTPAAVYAWLGRAGISPQDLGDTPPVRRAIESEVGSLSPYTPSMERLFRS